MAILVFWLSVAAILYTYLGYPALVWVLGRLRARRVARRPITPRVTVVLACHNEAANVEARIINLLESDYPKPLLDVFVVSDGSTDATAELARRFTSRVRVIEYPVRAGKPTALNRGVAATSGEIVVFADARQRFETGTIRQLVSNFADPRVGAASGELFITRETDSAVAEGVGLYWKYEKSIRRSESRFNSVVGVTGAVYAIRRELWRLLPPETILDDVYTPMQIAEQGYQIVFDETARAFDRASRTATHEFSRKVRTLTGNYQLCRLMPSLLAPTSLLKLQFHSHKLMRLVAPIFFLSLLVSNAILAGKATGLADVLLFQTALALQCLFYLGVGVAALLLKRNISPGPLRVPFVFSLMNAAALVGLFFFLTRREKVWSVDEAARTS